MKKTYERASNLSVECDTPCTSFGQLGRVLHATFVGSNPTPLTLFSWENMQMMIDDIYKTYEKYTIEDFWKWMYEKGKHVVEIRILGGKTHVDYEYLRSFAKSHDLVMFGSSFFVSSSEELEIIINDEKIVKNYNVYYGLNPRKKVFYYSKKYKKAYLRYGTKSVAVKQLKFIPFDIEAVDRKGDATPDQLRKAMKLADAIIRILSNKFKWEDYITICSGNGIHLIFRIPDGITIPEAESHIDYAQEEVRYKMKPEFVRMARIGNKFLEKIESACKEDGEWMFGAKFDRVGDLARVLRLPFTLNNKPEYDVPRRSGVMDIHTQKWSDDYFKVPDKLLSLRGPVKVEGAFSHHSHDDRHVYTPEDLRTSPIAQLLLMENLPSGSRNHYLEFQFALLMRDNNIMPEQVQGLIDDINSIQGKKINVDPQYLKEGEHFNQDVVNAWCINNLMAPVYPVLERKIRARYFDDRFFDYVEHDGEKSDKTWPECLDEYKEKIDEKKSKWEKIWTIQACIMMLNVTMGHEFTRFVCESGILKRHLET